MFLERKTEFVVMIEEAASGLGKSKDTAKIHRSACGSRRKYLLSLSTEQKSYMLRDRPNTNKSTVKIKKADKTRNDILAISTAEPESPINPARITRPKNVITLGNIMTSFSFQRA